MSSVAEQPLHRALGLTDGEFDRICDLLGRAPNDFELGVFSLLWSEHCGYKHSALLLRRFPSSGEAVLQGPGENAGVVDLGEGEAVAFKVESHNHPSAVEPFQGAATGVGGILRDVVAMGARPIALLDGLRFGAPDFAFWRAVAGIGHYGNCLAAEERVLFRNSGRVRPAAIGELAESRSGLEADEWTVTPTGPFEVLSVDPRTLRPSWRAVSRLFKRQATELLRFTTALGRAFTVTPDHPVVVWENGRLTKRAASEVSRGDAVPLLCALPSAAAESPPIDLLELAEVDAVVQLPGDWAPSPELRRALCAVLPRADARHYWLRRRELPSRVFRLVEDSIGLPRHHLRLRLPGPRSTSVPAIFPLDLETARLIGYYLAEGCCSPNGTTSRIVWTFGRGARDAVFVSDLCSTLARLGVRHSIEERRATVAVTVSSRILATLLTERLECGSRAHEKQIPSELFSDPTLLAEAVRGILAGDGSIQLGRRGSPVRVSHLTTSRALHDQLLVALQSFGVLPSRYERYSPGTIQGRPVQRRKGFALEVVGYESVSRLIPLLPEIDQERVRGAIEHTKASPFARPSRRGQIATVPITRIERLAGPAAVYDFEVPGTHLFATSGGIVTHNCVGVPTVGGEAIFDEAYAQNPLVNAMCVGVLPAERVTRARATGPGNLVVLFGATTGRDGIGGASVLASQELSEEDEDKRPTVQIGDPFTGKKLIEASLALVESGIVLSLQDLGAAGLASSLAEMAGRGGAGIDVRLDRVPLREPDLDPVEIMLSESQERMVAVVEPDRLDAAKAICRTWELAFAVIGEVTDTGELRAFHTGELVGAVPVSFLTDETPRYRVETRPRALPPPIEHRSIAAGADDLLDLLASPNVASRRPIFERYDQLVGSRTVRRPGLDAAVLRLRPSLRGLAVSLDGSGRVARLDPRTGGARAVIEAARNVACAGGRPLALTDCLNFGNPERPEVAWELAEAIEGMALAAEALGLPVVSGNVSLYNETDGRAIDPTPVVGCVGLVADVRDVPGAWREGDVVLVASGGGTVALDGSEYQAWFLGGAAGRPPAPDLRLESALVRFLWRSSATLSAAHDAAEGGLAVALAELAVLSGIGAEVELGADAVDWFGEGGGRALVACRREDVARLAGVELREIGVVGGGRLLGLPVDELRRAYAEGVAP